MLFLTFSMITLIHWLIKTKYFSDRDDKLKLREIIVFEGNLIASDCIIFFLVGRLWCQRGVDHLAWIITILLCNVYFESQQFVSWLRHSVSLYEMHCIWPWQLWTFAGLLIPLLSFIAYLHARNAYRERILWRKLGEIFFFVLFYLTPVISSPYFHFHHWFAGWLLGMHCNFDVWWSRAAMAWCWGMYINGIAVYGRDPVLTCEYAYFLSMDNRCPYMECYTEAMKLKNETGQSGNVTEMIPVDWRNCSSEGFHP